MSSVNQQPVDVAIVGAGAAGLSAAIELARAGMRPLIVEARDRIGGRMFTLHESGLQAPIELGAEFIHGLPPEVWQILQKQKVVPIEMEGDDWCFREGKLSQCDFFSEVDELLGRLDASKPDESFSDFMAREGKNVSPETRDWANAYIAGFHAADPNRIGVHYLVRTTEADEKIAGHRSFRIPSGYGWLVEHLRRNLEELGVPVLLNTVVERVEWKPGAVELRCRENGEPLSLNANRALITVPLGVLQAGSPKFSPELPAEKREALTRLAMGNVMRINLHFRERFWDRISPALDRPQQTLSDMAFLFSRQEWFPTWWTSTPRKVPLLTAWAPSGQAERLSGRTKDFILSSALDSLAQVLNQPRSSLQNLLESAHYHDWQSDPFSRGAYSYACVGADGAEERLGRPVANTLFFAGEATDVTGHNGTVHGAIASAQRVARDILAN